MALNAGRLRGNITAALTRRYGRQPSDELVQDVMDRIEAGTNPQDAMNEACDAAGLTKETPADDTGSRYVVTREQWQAKPRAYKMGDSRRGTAKMMYQTPDRGACLVPVRVEDPLWTAVRHYDGGVPLGYVFRSPHQANPVVFQATNDRGLIVAEIHGMPSAHIEVRFTDGHLLRDGGETESAGTLGDAVVAIYGDLVSADPYRD